MKTIFSSLFIALIIGNSPGYAQKPSLPIDEKTNKPVYTEVINVESVAATDLYARAVNWFKTYFKNPSSVIKENDPATHRINGQYRVYIFNEVDGLKNKSGQVRFRIEIVSKEGRYKYKVHDIFKNIPFQSFNELSGILAFQWYRFTKHLFHFRAASFTAYWFIR